MNYPFKNIVFSGAGIAGISYIGVAKYLDEINLLSQIKRVGGCSAGAISACILSFNLKYIQTEQILNTLDYPKVAMKYEIDDLEIFDKKIKHKRKKSFSNIKSMKRFVSKYGLYSSSYLYEWLKKQISLQFDDKKKKPPYTFKDFKDKSIHKDKREFKDLYIIGTNITKNTPCIFSYENTPNMEVAEAIRISASIPFIFEAIKSDCGEKTNKKSDLFADGGLVKNYPLNIFDEKYPKEETFGVLFENVNSHNEIKNLVDYIKNVIYSSLNVQTEFYNKDHQAKLRTIEVITKDLKIKGFDVNKKDPAYTILFEEGYNASKMYFDRYREI